MTTIKQQNFQILERLDQPTNKCTNFKTSDLPVEIPINRNENLKTLNSYLKENGVRDLVSSKVVAGIFSI